MKLAKEPPEVLRLVVLFLRDIARLSQAELGRAARVSQSELSLFESGRKTPSEDALRRLAAAADVPWPLVAHLRRFYAAFLEARIRGEAVEADAPPAAQFRLAGQAYQLEDAAAEASAADEIAQAEHFWQVVAGLPRPRRRRVVELSPCASRSWALARHLCHESERTAAADVRESLDLADLALWIAQRCERGGEQGRSLLVGYAWGYKGNAFRVACQRAEADEAWVWAWMHWQAGATAKSDLLPEWRLFSLEASLRRDERQFSQALERLDRALESAQGDVEATAVVLLNKETVYEQMGDLPKALEALQQATPFVEASEDRRLLFALRFKAANNLYHLERHAEAAGLLPQVREMAVQLGNALDQVKVSWLEARVEAGLGKREEAVAGLERVRREFTARDNPYNAALAALDLAMLYLEEGRAADVKDLAREAVEVFKAQGIAREALASLNLFVEAAQREKATAEMVKRLVRDVEEAGAPGAENAPTRARLG